MPPETFATTRLLLRQRRPEDSDAIFERWAGDPVATRYVRWATHKSVDETRERFAQLARPKPEGAPSERTWVICVDGDPLPSGSIGLTREGASVEIGFVLARPCWGRGLMTEAVRAVVARVWDDATVEKLHAHAHVDNVASQRVLEKCGLRREGVARRAYTLPRFDEPQDAVLYAMTRGDLA